MKGTYEKLKDLKTFKWIFNKTKSQTLNFVLLNVVNIIYSFLSIYLILVSKNVIDSATSGDFLSLKRYFIELVVVSLAEIVLKVILASIDAVTRAKLEIGFKQNVLKTILSKKYKEISKIHSGDLMTRIVSDVNVIIETLVSLIPYLLSLITRLACAVILLFQISKEFVVILLTGGVALFIVVNLFKPYIKNIHKKVQEASANVRLFFKEVFDNFIVIKIFESEKVILHKSRDLQYERYNIQMKRRSISILSSAGFSTIFQVVYLFALIWSANNLYLGKITVGELTSIVQLIAQVQAPIIGLSRSFQSVFTMLGSAERIIELEEIEDDIASEHDIYIETKELYSNMKSLEVDSVDFTYDNKPVLQNANLTVNKGEIVAIYGESGIGKSTLLKLILGLIDKDNGKIYFKCDDTNVEISKNTRGMFTYVPQGKFIISGTIRENLTLVRPDASEKDLQEALDVSMCTSFINELPEGLETKIGERGSGLSEGQFQRLSLARAIVSGSPILILDEITSSLDSATEAAVLKNIRNLQNRTCIIVTHRTSISTICDREYEIRDCQIYEK